MASVPDVCGRHHATQTLRVQGEHMGQPMSSSSDHRERIRSLNDDFRTTGPVQARTGRWVLTAGVTALGSADAARAISLVMAFSDFDAANDPHGEHDFGIIRLAGKRLYWKIDYYNLDLDGGSEDPADEAQTCRVLTIMLASEY